MDSMVNNALIAKNLRLESWGPREKPNIVFLLKGYSNKMIPNDISAISSAISFWLSISSSHHQRGVYVQEMETKTETHNWTI